METLQTIKAEYNLAIGQAQNVEDIGGRLENVSVKLQEILGSLGSDWRGGSADKYMRKGNQLVSNMQKTAKSLKNTGGTIRTVAKNTRNMKEERLRILQEKPAPLMAGLLASGAGHSSGGGKKG